MKILRRAHCCPSRPILPVGFRQSATTRRIVALSSERPAANVTTYVGSVAGRPYALEYRPLMPRRCRWAMRPMSTDPLWRKLPTRSHSTPAGAFELVALALGVGSCR